jgi:hypothetical protein
MKKKLIPLILLFLVFGGCVRSSTLKRAINDSEAAKREAASSEEANKTHLEEIASLQKDMDNLRLRNAGLVEDNLKKAEEIASLKAVVKGKTSENNKLEKELEAIRAAGAVVKEKKASKHVYISKYGNFLETLREDFDMGSIGIIKGGDTLSLLLKDKALFNDDTAALLPEGKALLQRISSATDELRLKGSRVKISPLRVSATGDKHSTLKTKSLALERSAVIRRFLNNRADEKKAATHGMPYEKGTDTTLSGFTVELVFPNIK